MVTSDNVKLGADYHVKWSVSSTKLFTVTQIFDGGKKVMLVTRKNKREFPCNTSDLITVSRHSNS